MFKEYLFEGAPFYYLARGAHMSRAGPAAAWNILNENSDDLNVVPVN
jgi:hypothetical protein